MNPINRFEKERKAGIRKLSHDKKMEKVASEFFLKSVENRYLYNFDWLGRPIIQFPQDIMAMQELIWRVKPDLIIETGIAHGGSLIFYASMLELLGRGEVLGIDTDIREHNKKEVERHRMFKRISMIEGSSTAPEVMERVKKLARKHKIVLVCLDSHHTKEHVLKELQLYSPFVSAGSYIVVFDTAIERLPQKLVKNRLWGKGNNPGSAVKVFLNKNKNFAIDREIEDKIIITANPGGFIKRIK